MPINRDLGFQFISDLGQVNLFFSFGENNFLPEIYRFKIKVP